MKTIKLIFSTMIVFFAINTYATIVYTDINPDGMPTGGGLDFDGDGTNEFRMSSAFYFEYTWSAGGNNIWANGQPVGQGSGWDEPKPLALNTVIDNSGNFIGCGDCAISGISTNPFATMVNQDKFLGVRLKINSNTHYGWVRLVWNGTTFIYKDFAYENTPNKSIKAGDNGIIGINITEKKRSFSVYPNPANKSIFVNLKDIKEISKIKIYSVLGKEVKDVRTTNINLQKIDISELKKGIYFVNIFCDDKIIDSQKIIVI